MIKEKMATYRTSTSKERFAQLYMQSKLTIYRRFSG